MQITVEAEYKAFPVTIEREYKGEDCAAVVLDLVDSLAAAGIEPRKRRGGGFGESNRAPEAWAPIQSVRVFAYGDGKHAMKFSLEPEAGSFEAREAVAFDYKLLDQFPEEVAKALRDAWTSGKNKEFILKSVPLEAGIITEPKGFRVVAVREAGKAVA